MQNSPDFGFTFPWEVRRAMNNSYDPGFFASLVASVLGNSDEVARVINRYTWEYSGDMQSQLQFILNLLVGFNEIGECEG